MRLVHRIAGLYRALFRSDVANYYARLVDAVRAIPGVTSAALVNRIPLEGQQINPVSFPPAAAVGDALTTVDTRTVTPGYFATLGIRLLDGRTFTERDNADAPEVAVVDDRVARTMWPGESAVGKHFNEPPWRGAGQVTVIGVVAHVRTDGVEVDVLPQVYWSTRQWTQDRMVLAVRSEVEASALVAPVGATALLMLGAPAASYVPARRAAAVDPGMTLRAA